jgi:hypothetical protein
VNSTDILVNDLTFIFIWIGMLGVNLSINEKNKVSRRSISQHGCIM